MQRNASMMPSLMTPLKFTRRRSSIVVADIPVPEIKLDLDYMRKNRDIVPKVFQEPETSSLLDQFGF